MPGQRFNLFTLVALAMVTSGAAQGADYYQPYQPPPQPIIVQQPPQEIGNNWYLRGFVGIGMNGKADLQYQPAPANVGNGFSFSHNDIADTYFLGGAIGYDWNSWLRFDVSGEYRAKTRVYAYGTYPPSGLDEYQGYLKSWVFLANAFVDLGTWECFTPFVGVGIGAANVSLVDFTDTNPNGGNGIGRNSSAWNLAWALYAGVDYNVSKNLKVELSYRYLNYGSVTDTVDCAGGCNADSFKFDNLYSNDIMVGLRWTCCDFGPPPPRYVYRPPPPVYQPPPPPISSRG